MPLRVLSGIKLFLRYPDMYVWHVPDHTRAKYSLVCPTTILQQLYIYIYKYSLAFFLKFSFYSTIIRRWWYNRYGSRKAFLFKYPRGVLKSKQGVLNVALLFFHESEVDSFYSARLLKYQHSTVVHIIIYIFHFDWTEYF